jgi:hypothetical protein
VKEIRKAFKDWRGIDQAALLAVKQAARQELTKPDQPIRLTKTRLLRGAAGVRSNGHRDHYPLASAEAEGVAETKMQFAKRAIRWALQKLAEQNLAISLHRLEPLVSMSPKSLMVHRSYIIEVATELEMTFDGRSLLAPLSENPDDCACSAVE